MDSLTRFVENDAFARHLGVEMLSYGDGRASARMEIGPQHVNSFGLVHGAAIFSLADATFSAAANSRGTLALAIDVSISFLEAVKDGVLTAEAREVALNPKLGTYLIEVKDEGGRLVALFRGTVYRKKTGIADVTG